MWKIVYEYYLKHIVAVLTVCTLLPVSIFSQDKGFIKSEFTKVARLEGLKVICILKDTYGFMWFGTETGLYRYDGYNTELINTTSANIRLTSDQVLSLFEDRQKSLWIGTANGLQQLSADRKCIKTFLSASDMATAKKGIHAIAEMHDGSLWCSSDDGYLYRSADKKSFSRIPGSFIAGYKNTRRIVLFITEDENHQVWVADNLYGFQKLNLQGRILNQFPPVNYESNINIACFANKSECFYANQQNVYSYVLQTNQFIPEQNKQLVNLLKSPVRYVYQDKKGCRWLVTQTKLIRYNPRLRQTDDFTGEFMNSGASLFQIDCMYEDSNDQLWFGSYFGVYRLNNQKKIFRIISLPAGMGSNAYFSTRGIIESVNGDLFIGSYSGFFKYNKDQKKFKEYKIKRNDKWVNPLVRAMVSDNKGNLWLATEANGLLYFDTQSQAFTAYLDKTTLKNKNDPDTILSTHNNSLLKDSQGQLWMGGYDNLYTFNPLSRTAKMFTWEGERKSFSSIKIMVIYQSHDQSVWVGTNYGLYHIKNNKNQVIHFTLSEKNTGQPRLTNNFINCIYEDANGLLWLGTKGGGINVFNPVNGQVEKVYTAQDGLADDKVCAILPGTKSELWISTYNGLSCLNIKSKSFRNFYVSDGLPTNEFNQGSALTATDSTLYFGSMNGIAVLNLGITPPPVKETQVMLTKLVKHNGKENKIEETALDIQDLKNIKLDYRDRFFTVYFTLKDYLEHTDANCRYAYRLDGITNQWQNIGAANYIQFAGLPAGTYKLRIKGMSNDGIWVKKELQIPVAVSAAFYVTTAAYIFYTIVILTIIAVIFNFRISSLRLQNKLQLEHLQKEKMQELDQIKSRFFTNITHEFRTPLTLIISPLEELLTEQIRSESELIKQQHNIMYRNAQRLLRLINQLLDAAKLEASSMSLSESQGNVALFVGQIIDSFQMEAHKKKIILNYIPEDDISAEYFFDMEKLEKIVYNLLSNAIKFTPSGGKVLVELICKTTSEKYNELNLKVTDTGAGIPERKLSAVFDRFYQVSAQNTGGSGLGLFLVKELSGLMGGKVDVESREGKGTAFTVIIPLQSAGASVRPVEEPAKPVIVEDESGIIIQNVPALSKMHPLVLVAEDHDDLRNFIVSGLLTKYRVLPAKNGGEGWKLAQQELPDLIIADVAMPEMDGFTLSHFIKSTPLTAHIAVILLTAKASSENRLQGLATGANDYLTKPFNLQELHLRIENLLNYQNRLRDYWHQKLAQPFVKEIPASGDEAVAEDPFMLAVDKVLEVELANADFTVDQLAGEMTVSPRTLHRKLSSLTGMNATELIRSYRLNKAAVFLQKGYSVSEAADKTGFESLSYFSKCFKSQFSVSPSGYILSKEKKQNTD